MMKLSTITLTFAAFQGADAFLHRAFNAGVQKATRVRMAPSMLDAGWSIDSISPDGSLTQIVQGKTRKTWKFNDLTKDRVQVGITSGGRPVHADIQLWLGPDWTPFKMKAYSEDGKNRPIQTLVGTRNKAAMIEVRNQGEYEFPINAASNYAKSGMEKVPIEMPENINGETIQGGALKNFVIDPGAEQIVVLLNTDGKQLNARIELLNAPNNPKQTFECFTNNGELNCLCVCFNTIDPGNTVRIVNLAPVEFPCYAHLHETMGVVLETDASVVEIGS